MCQYTNKNLIQMDEPQRNVYTNDCKANKRPKINQATEQTDGGNYSQTLAAKVAKSSLSNFFLARERAKFNKSYKFDIFAKQYFIK